MRILLFLVCISLGACAGTDHRRIITLNAYVFDDAKVEICPEILLEKSGAETSTADNATDIQATIPLVP